jgi:hypothetical protein
VYEGGQIPRIHGGGGAYRTCTLTFRAPCFHSDDDRVGRLVLIAARLRSAGRRDETPSELTRLFLITPKKSRSASLTKLVASDLALQRSTMYCSVRLGRVRIFVEFSCIRVLLGSGCVEAMRGNMTSNSCCPSRLVANNFSRA